MPVLQNRKRLRRVPPPLFGRLVMVAPAKFCEVVRLPSLPKSRLERVICAIHACTRQGQQARQAAFAHWPVGKNESIRQAADSVRPPGLKKA